MSEHSEIWERQTSVENLRRHFEFAVANARRSGRDGITVESFRSRLDDNLLAISDRLRRLDYRFSAYGQKLISRGAHRLPREIAVPTVRDRVALRAMTAFLNEIEPVLRIELPQSKVARLIAALEHGSERFVQLDVRDFYPSISHDVLRARLLDIMNEGMADIYMAAAATPTMGILRGSKENSVRVKGVPQGLAISNGLAELAMRDVDNVARGASYFRYVDDILLLGDASNLPMRTRQVRAALTRVGLDVHGDESSKSGAGTVREGFEYLGYRFEWPRVTVRAESVRRMENTLARVFTTFRYAMKRAENEHDERVATGRLIWHANLIISGFTLNGARRGWLPYYSLIRDQQVLRHLDSLVEKFALRFGVDRLLFKSFRQAYRFAARSVSDTTGYMPNFDRYFRADKSEVLVEVFGQDKEEVDALSDDALEVAFARRIERVAAELDRDVARAY